MENLIQTAHSLFGITLTGQQMESLELLERELIACTEKVNLTSIRDPESVRLKHTLDSLSCVLAWKENPPESLIDVGTGAGFPGLPLKILYPNMRLTLVESIGKKTAFCTHMVELLGLKDVQVVTGRAEEAGRQKSHREAYQWAVARAVANLPVLVEYLLPLCRVGGWMLAQKGASGPEESQAAEKAIRKLGGRFRTLLPVTLPGITEDRYLIVVEKVSPTPAEYPRLPGTPSKKPLQ